MYKYSQQLQHERRNQYQGYKLSKTIDSRCMNHGSCIYCKSNRLYNYIKRLQATNNKLQDYNKEE